MNKVQLSPHFKLSEFTKSSTATARHIDNTPNDEQVKNLKALCENVLEPLRQHFNVPIIIGSGFRCPKLNNTVGGVANSQHQYGEAADIHIPDEATGRQWIEHLLEYCLFDQLIWEHDKSGHYWIHVSFKRIDRNRQTYIPNLLKK